MSSWVWEHFQVWEENNLKSECRICGTKISRGKDLGHLTTSSMITHLKSLHGISQPKRTRSDAIGPDQPGPSTDRGKRSHRQQPTIKQAFEKLRKFDRTHPKSVTITKRIGEMIAADFLPYSIVENAGFQRLMNELEPRYQLPSRRLISETIVPKIYDEVRNKVKGMISRAVGSVCATTDIWSSRENDSFMSVTANFLAYDDGKLKRFTPVLCCKEVVEHNSEAILRELRREEEAWGMKFAIMLSDNATNVTKALADGGIMNVRCMAHTINLCVCHALDVQRSIKDMVSASRSIVGHYHRSNRDSALLAECQERLNAPQHKMIQDVQTRWNSTYYMLERLLEQREAINEMSYQGVGSTLTNNQWRLAASVVRILSVFEKTTKEICCDSATISCILPAVRNMLHKLSTFISDSTTYGSGTFMSDLKDQIERRFIKPIEGVNPARESYFRDTKIYDKCFVASILDPRVKSAWCPDISRVEIERLVFESLADVSAPGEATASAPESSDPSSSEEESMIFPHVHRRGQTAQTSGEDRNSAISTSLSKYLDQRPISSKRCPIQFWESMRSECPELFQLAVTLLSCPPTSVDSERLFSSAGVVVSPLRNRLSPKNVQMLTFLHVNLKKLDFAY